jgi:hypothetical protein
MQLKEIDLSCKDDLYYNYWIQIKVRRFKCAG